MIRWPILVTMIAISVEYCDLLYFLRSLNKLERQSIATVVTLFSGRLDFELDRLLWSKMVCNHTRLWHPGAHPYGQYGFSVPYHCALGP